MAVEAGGFTGIIEADEVVLAYLRAQRGLDDRAIDELRARIVRADAGATYCARFEVDLAAIPPMVATPGDPRNGVPLASLGEGVKIDIAYGGSCTGGKKADMDMYAEVLARAVQAGARVATSRSSARRGPTSSTPRAERASRRARARATRPTR
jgi:3-isopropylmalate/(R)-2-methylmalate dehydratase large subunit